VIITTWKGHCTFAWSMWSMQRIWSIWCFYTAPSECKTRLRNDLYCVEWGVKLYSLTHSRS